MAGQAGQGSVAGTTGSWAVCFPLGGEAGEFGGRWGGWLVVYYYNLSEWLWRDFRAL